MSAFRAAVRFLGLDAHPEREDVPGSPWDIVWFMVGLGVILGLLVVGLPA